jgi:hypothetical protein
MGNDASAGTGGVSAQDAKIVEGIARRDGTVPCPACGRPVIAGQEVVTSLGDVERGVVGVTIHRRCFVAIGRPGLLELMLVAAQQRNA